jgi:putative solute:sodium symporter small subunit
VSDGDTGAVGGAGRAGRGGSRHREYWRRNIRYLVGLLSVWFLVSYGFGILLAEPLNAFRVPGTGIPVGFWFAQQGSIYVFVALIFVYVRLMNRLDREFDVDERDPA